MNVGDWLEGAFEFVIGIVLIIAAVVVIGFVGYILSAPMRHTWECDKLGGKYTDRPTPTCSSWDDPKIILKRWN